MILWGIDPGTHTGLAVWDTKKQEFKFLATMPIHRALLKLREEKDTISAVYCENPNTFIPYKGVSQRTINLRKQGAGSVKRDFAIWRDACKDYGINFIPTSVRGAQKKMDAKTFKKHSGWHGKTSEHARDAGNIVIGMR